MQYRTSPPLHQAKCSAKLKYANYRLQKAIICVFYLLLEAARLEDLAGRLAVRLEDLAGRLAVRLEDLAGRLAVRLEDLAGRLAVRLEDRFAAAFFTRFAIICLLNLLVFLS